jgi:hypothetical protein
MDGNHARHGRRGGGNGRGRLRAGAVALLALLALGGCSRQKLVVTASLPLLQSAMLETYASDDVQTARAGIPAELMLLRGLCRSDPTRLETWSATVQLYASYALIFVEDDDPDWALALYDEGRGLGLRFLRRYPWFAAAWDAGPDSLRAEIARRRPVDLGPLMMWTGACLGQHVLRNQDKPMEMLDLPYVGVLLDAAIDLASDYFYGMPYAAKGMTLAMIPLGLGGNLEESDRYFQQAFKVSGDRFLLHQVLYARYWCTKALDEACFTQHLENVRSAPENLLPEMRFVNRLAKDRAERLLEQRAEYF